MDEKEARELRTRVDKLEIDYYRLLGAFPDLDFDAHKRDHQERQEHAIERRKIRVSVMADLVKGAVLFILGCTVTGFLMFLQAHLK